MALGWKRRYLRYQKYYLNILALYKKRQDLKMFLEILLSLATIAFFAVFALKPTLLTIAQLKREVDTKKETVVKMEQKIQNLSRASALFNREISRLSLLDTAVPSNPSPGLEVRQIEGIAKKNKVSILGISLGEITLVGQEKEKFKEKKELKEFPEGAKAISLSINVSGTYPDLVAFLSDLESLRRPLRIDAISFNLISTEEKQTIVLTLAGRAPYLKD